MSINGAISILTHAYEWCESKGIDQEYIGRAIYTARANLQDGEGVGTAQPLMGSSIDGTFAADDSRTTDVEVR